MRWTTWMISAGAAVALFGCSEDTAVLFPCPGPSCPSLTSGGSGGSGVGGASGGSGGASCSDTVPATLDQFDGYALDYLSIAVDEGSVYYADGNPSSTIRKREKAGQASAILATFQLTWVTTVAIDDADVYATIVSFPDQNTDHGSLVRIPKAGGSVETLTERDDFAHSVAADSQSLYWIYWDFHTHVSQLMRMAKAGGQAEILATGAIDGFSLDDDRAYVWSSAGTISSLSKQGGAITTIASGEVGPFAVRADGADLYWVTSDNRIRKVAKTGGAPIDVAVATGAVTTLFTREGSVFWSEWGDTTKASARVLRLDLDSGTTHVIASMQANPAALAIDASGAYWINRGELSQAATSSDPASHALVHACD